MSSLFRISVGEFTGVRAFELTAGDVIRYAEGIGRVTRGPETLHRGWSLFDEFQLLVGVRVEPLEQGTSGGYLVLDPGELVSAWRGTGGVEVSGR
jgi:hypothetical protein